MLRTSGNQANERRQSRIGQNWELDHRIEPDHSINLWLMLLTWLGLWALQAVVTVGPSTNAPPMAATLPGGLLSCIGCRNVCTGRPALPPAHLQASAAQPVPQHNSCTLGTSSSRPLLMRNIPPHGDITITQCQCNGEDIYLEWTYTHLASFNRLRDEAEYRVNIEQCLLQARQHMASAS